MIPKDASDLFRRLTLVAWLYLAVGVQLGSTEVYLYVDAAPNVYASPHYSAWWSDAKAAAVSGNFIDMANSAYPLNSGSRRFVVEDVAVYGFSDFGRRLNFVYWIPDETIESLSDKNLQIRMEYEWSGTTYNYFKEALGETWQSPVSWVELGGGVIGTAGIAWLAAIGESTEDALQRDLSR